MGVGKDWIDEHFMDTIIPFMILVIPLSFVVVDQMLIKDAIIVYEGAIEKQTVEIEALKKQVPYHARFMNLVDELVEVSAGKLDASDIVGIAEIITVECAKNTDIGLTPDKILAVIERESMFSPDAISNKQAYGLMQLIRPTFSLHLEELGYSKWTAELALDPIVNVKAGIKELIRLRKYWIEEGVASEDWLITFTSYFWGPRYTWELFLNANKPRPSLLYGQGIIDLAKSWRERGVV